MAEGYAKLNFNRFPGGRTKALTMSYDDGKLQDKRLIEIFNRYGIKGTFHLNSGRLGNEGFVVKEEVAEVYKGHEVSVHTVTHPWLTNIPLAAAADEILLDRKNLEGLVGYPVRGMSFPFGSCSKRISEMLAGLGIVYARGTQSHGGFHLPENLLEWPPTCHHNHNLLELGNQFLKERNIYNMRVMYVWGHSYEFDNDRNWNLMEEFCSRIGRNEEIWYASNIEIADYITALERLQCSVDRSMIHNPSAIPVWISFNEQTVEIDPGKTLLL